MHRRVIRTASRSAIALVAVYALLLNALLSASAPFVPTSSGDAIVCLHDVGGPDQPTAPPWGHADSCCIAICGMGIAALPPSDYSRVPLLRVSTLAALEWSHPFVAPSPPPNAQASPRGPPSLI
jgi:hypothetical protein